MTRERRFSTGAGAGRRACLRAGALLVAGLALHGRQAWAADAVLALRAFVRDARSGRGEFTQTVTSPDGQRRRTSSGSFEFQRPNRFRFSYQRPFEQTIVSDGQRVWTYDPDLNQAVSRQAAQALGATPAALLAGGSLDDRFTLVAEPARDGLDWVLATPRDRDAPFQTLRVGFRGADLAAVEVVDGFGQRSVLRFGAFQTNLALPEDRFRFSPPAGADVIEQ
jgi:outer membrane lipoprotein carrier protein